MATNDTNLAHISSSDEEALGILEISDCSSDEEMSEYGTDDDAFGFSECLPSSKSEDSDEETPCIELAKRKSTSSSRSAKRLQVFITVFLGKILKLSIISIF